MTLSINPRSSLRARMAFLSGGAVLVLSLLVSSIAGALTRNSIERQIGSHFVEQATRILDTLDRGMFERLREIQIATTLPNLRDPRAGYDSKRSLLEKMQTTYTSYAWIGVAAPDGKGEVGTGGYLEGKDLSIRPWFKFGRQGPYVGDVHDALLLAKILPNPSGEMIYLLDVAAPIYNTQDQLAGVLCGHIHWQWTEEVIKTLDAPGVEVLLIGQDGMVLAGPREQWRKPVSQVAPGITDLLMQEVGFTVTPWKDNGDYLVGFATAKGYRDYRGLGWRIVLRQKAEDAFAPAQALEQRILWTGAAMGLLCTLLAWWLAGRMARPIEELSRAAQRISDGELNLALPAHRSSDEIGVMSASLQRMVRTLTDDIQALRRAEDRLQLAAVVFEHSSEGILITDADQRIVHVNPAFSRITGYAREDILGQTPRLLQSHRQSHAFYIEMWDQLRREDYWEGEIWNKRKDGKIYPEWLTITAVRNADHVLTHFIAVFLDISERKAALEHIEYLASHDILTGLPGRTVLQDRLDVALRHARRTGQRGAVVFIDLDQFKQVNDTFGHQIGDQLLIEIGQRLSAVLRQDDTLTRQGGDEFIVLLPDIADERELHAHIGRLLTCLREPVMIDGHSLLVSCSMGVALFPDDGQDRDTLLRHADMAMYRAKEQGRDRYEFFTPEMNLRMQRRRELESVLRQALGGEANLALHYQPKAAVAGNHHCGMEALLRCTTREGLPVSPAELIPVAEDTGLIVQVGAWVAEQTCAQIRAWLDAGFDPGRVAINASVRELALAGYAGRLLAIMARYQLEGCYLEVEITESLFAASPERFTHELDTLRQHGVTIAIDDFGTGYASLSMLRQLPVDVIKIDRSFVDGCAHTPNSAALVRAILGMARSLQLTVVAEGVEDPEDLALLATEGCEVYQGFLFSRPQPADSFHA